MASPTQISVQQLSRLIGTPDCPAIVDCCIDPDFELDPHLIPGAFRHSHTELDALAAKLRGRRAIIICQQGKKLSEGVAASLRHEGIAAENLAGGMFAWREADLPAVPYSALPPLDPQGRTVWVTRQRPKIDRLACPWLIRRFVDPSAVFLFVNPKEVMDVAEKFRATPFDVEGAFWSHRGDQCTFDTMLDEFGLQTEALARLATVVRGADTNRHDLAPEAAGLLAISVGLSRMFRDDIAQLEAGMTVYDAWYRWARDGFDEGHDWPSATA